MRKFIVGGGNNPAVIRKALAERGNWEEVPFGTLYLGYLPNHLC